MFIFAFGQFFSEYDWNTNCDLRKFKTWIYLYNSVLSISFTLYKFLTTVPWKVWCMPSLLCANTYQDSMQKVALLAEKNDKQTKISQSIWKNASCKKNMVASSAKTTLTLLHHVLAISTHFWWKSFKAAILRMRNTIISTIFFLSEHSTTT